MNESKQTTSVIPEQACTGCGYKVDRSSGDGQPEDGDFNVCLNCGHMSKYQGVKLELNNMEPETFDQLQRASAKIKERGPLVQAAIRQFLDGKIILPKSTTNKQEGRVS